MGRIEGDRFAFGPSQTAGGTELRVWAPGKRKVSVRLGDGRELEMTGEELGFWRLDTPLDAGERYCFILDGKGPYPDPASRYQPEGISGLSEITDRDSYSWGQAGWKGIELGEFVIEEVHTGTFTPGGTFDSAVEKLESVASTGITAIELMPVAQFHGARNWGYDGVLLYAPHNSYGNPDDLKHLVDSIHAAGMAAILDVVYNHIGPAGGFLSEFGPFLSRRHSTPWGAGLNYDGEMCDPVREHVIRNALYWVDEFRFDALRLDAIHGIMDTSPEHLLSEMSRRVASFSAASGRKIYLIAESDLNDSMVVRGRGECGYGLDAQWNDDFHHSVHTYITGENAGYYSDYSGAADIASSLLNGFVYDGKYSANLSRRRGAPWGDLPFMKLVACVQNHDQIGNRAFGERLTALADRGKVRFAASLLLLSPFTPMLFQGEEYGETAPFLFFIDTDDTEFARRVREGRRREFERFGWTDTPDPVSAETFMASKLRWNEDEGSEKSRAMYRKLTSLRRRYITTQPGRHSFVQADGVGELAYGSGMKVFISLCGGERRIDAGEDTALVFHSESAEYGGAYSAPGGGRFTLHPYSVAAVAR